MPQPSMPRPTPQMNNGVPLPGGPQPQVGATGGTGGNGGNGGTGVPKPDVAPLTVKPTPAQPKLAAAAPKEEAPIIIAPAPIVENSSSKPHGK